MTNSYIKSLSGLDYDSTRTKLPESPALTSLILRYCLMNLLYPVYIGAAGLMRLDLTYSNTGFNSWRLWANCVTL